MSDEGTQVTTGDASLLDHSDRRKWNDKHAAAEPTFGTHPLVTRALDSGLRSGAVLELACGISGSALHLAGLGFSVTAVDVSDIALLRLMSEARHRGTEDRVIAVWEDLAAFEPANEAFELVLCTYYWNSALFTRACAAVTPGGLLAWEAVTDTEQGFRRSWCVGPGEPASLLPDDFVVVEQEDIADGRHATRRLLSRRLPR